MIKSMKASRKYNFFYSHIDTNRIRKPSVGGHVFTYKYCFTVFFHSYNACNGLVFIYAYIVK